MDATKERLTDRLERVEGSPARAGFD